MMAVVCIERWEQKFIAVGYSCPITPEPVVFVFVFVFVFDFVFVFAFTFVFCMVMLTMLIWIERWDGA